MLNLRQLRIVDAIVRSGTVTQAAERLFVTQPAVSHGLRQLETGLGVKLFRREGRRMVPTPEGTRLHETARTVLDELARAEYDMGQYRAGYQGIVHVATGCYTCYHWLPGIMGAFSDAFPDVDLQIVPAATNEPLEALKQGRLDLAIVETETDDRELHLEPLFDDELLVVMRPGHRLASRAFLVAEDFRDETLLVHIDHTQSFYYDRVLAPAGVEPARVFALHLTEALIESVKSGLGIAVMAEWVVAPEVAAGRLRAVRLTEGGMHRSWYLATRRGESSVPGKRHLSRRSGRMRRQRRRAIASTLPEPLPCWRIPPR
jgi:LysR family transcriptional regulator for metE and metH